MAEVHPRSAGNQPGFGGRGIIVVHPQVLPLLEVGSKGIEGGILGYAGGAGTGQISPAR